MGDLAPIVLGRKGGWSQTFTGKRFWPLDPRPEDVDIRDIAHHLSMLRRFGGAASRFYCVAEHSVHVSRRVKTPAKKLKALLHDAPEAYSPFGDVPRPHKIHLPIVAEIEDRLAAVIAPCFGLDNLEDDEIHVVDTAMCLTEGEALVGNTIDWGLPGDAAEGFPWGLPCWPPFYAEKMFLAEFNRLMGEGW